MSIESDIADAVGALVNDRIYPVAAPERTPKPFVTFQAVGGQPSNSFCGNTNRQNRRFQFNVWADNAKIADGIMQQIRAIVDAEPFRATVLGEVAWVDGYDTRTIGARQDFSFWF